jgi:hypothetical protein
MREEKILIRIFRKVAELIGDEASRNPEFATKLEAIVSELPAGRKTASKKKPAAIPAELPDVFAEWKTRQQSDFVLWLKDQPSVVLRAEIKVHELDPTGRTTKWKDPEKLAHFIAEQIRSRATRGSAFLTSSASQSAQS